MYSNTSSFFRFLCLALLSPCLAALHAEPAADAAVSRAEYAALAARVAQLEARLNAVQNQPLDTITQEVLAAMPEQAKGEASLIETVVAAVKQREQEVKFPWMDMAKWAPIRKGLTPAEVVEFLGDPTLDEPSLHRRIDFVYTYQGRRPATNQRVEGKIRFYKGVVVEVELPVID
jgi:BMFP domain-containing protein YqiC